MNLEDALQSVLLRPGEVVTTSPPPSSIPWYTKTIDISTGDAMPADYHEGMSFFFDNTWIPQGTPNLAGSRPVAWYITHDNKFQVAPQAAVSGTLRYIPVNAMEQWPSFTKWLVGSWLAYRYYMHHSPHANMSKALRFRARYEWWRKVLNGVWHKVWNQHRLWRPHDPRNSRTPVWR